MSRELEGQITLDESLDDAMPTETAGEDASLPESIAKENEVSSDNSSAEESNE